MRWLGSEMQWGRTGSVPALRLEEGLPCLGQHRPTSRTVPEREGTSQAFPGLTMAVIICRLFPPQDARMAVTLQFGILEFEDSLDLPLP